MPKAFSAALRNLAVPLVLYLAAFAVIRFEAIQHWSTAFFCEGGDGLQNVWNLWWVSWALRHDNNPFFTTFLHFPHGTSLVAHTLNPFNGFIGIPLSAVFTQVQTYNAIVIFSFVVGGLTAFLLSLELTGSYGGSLLCGYLFTFSEYHFAHAHGHLQLTALEWIPLFLLLFWRLLLRPSPARGVLAAIALFLVILCDYYYFVFCVLSGALLIGWHLLSQWRNHPWKDRSFVLSLATFLAIAVALSGPLLFALLRLSARDHLNGAHDPNDYSLDLLAPLIPGGTWRFAEWTRWYWQRLPGNTAESSVSWGLGAIILMIVAWSSRGPRQRWMGIWSFVLVFFTLMALGPRIRMLGRPVDHLHGPFALLVGVLPPLKLAGAPVRMSVIISLCVALLAGAGFTVLWRGSGQARAMAVLLVAIAIFGSWPIPQALTPGGFPPYVARLRMLPRGYGLFDVREPFGVSRALYYQTGHEIPIAHGYISRVPESVAAADRELDVLAERRQWQYLCERRGFRYLVFSAEAPVDPGLAASAIFEGVDDNFRFYDLGHLWKCREANDPS